MSRSFAFLLVVLAVLGVEARAESCTPPEGYRASLRPDPTGTPTVVTLGVLVDDVIGISDVGQSLEGDFIVRKRWRDPRLAGLDGCKLQRSVVWFPTTDVLNSNQLRRSRGQFGADQVAILPGGVVEYDQRFFGSISTYHSLEEFPFDTHRMPLRIAALEYPVDQLQIEIDPQFTGISEVLNIPDWSILDVEWEVVEEPLRPFGATYSIVHMDILAERNSQYFVWKVMLPLMLIVLMSFTVFWISPERFGPQISLAATSMLTLIAFQFALTSMLPKLSYFTRMDQLILGSTLLVFGSLIQATATSVLVMRDQTERALQVDRVCRWLFPLICAVIWVAVLI